MPSGAVGRPAVAKRLWPPWVIILTVAGMCRCSEAAAGAARFYKTDITVSELTRWVPLTITREGGSSGILHATVAINATSTDWVRGIDFELHGTEARWEDGDDGPIVVTVELFDTAFNPSPISHCVAIRLEAGVETSDVGQEASVCISLMAMASSFIFEDPFTTVRVMALDNSTQDNSTKCAFWVNRSGNVRGNASFHLEPSTCPPWLSGIPEAKRFIDYEFTRSEELVWGDGEDGRKCALYQVARPGSEVDFFLYPSGSFYPNEPDRVLCLFPATQLGLAPSFFSASTLVLGLENSVPSVNLNCSKGVNCTMPLDLTNLRLKPGDTAYLMDKTRPMNCSNPGGTATEELTIPADWLGNQNYTMNLGLHLWVTPGVWYVGMCLPNNETPVVLGTESVYGPQDWNYVFCFRGVPTCVMGDLTGFWSDTRNRSHEFVQILSSCGNPEATTDLVQRAGRGFSTSNGFNFTAPEVKDMPVGEYDLCWCQATEFSDCTKLRHFTVKAGTFVFIGPQIRLPDQYTLVDSTSSTPLSLEDLDGNMLESSDVASLQLTCGEPAAEGTFIRRNATAAGSEYDFGPIGNQDLLAGTYRLCWCPTREGIVCSDARDFRADFGQMTVMCPLPLVSARGTCQHCGSVFLEPNKERTGCQASVPRCIVVIVSFIFGGVSVWIALLQVELRLRCRCQAPRSCAVTTRRIAIENISPEGSRIIITTTARHFLRGFGRQIPVRFEGTGHFKLDGKTKAGFRVRVKSPWRLELLDHQGGPLAQRVDTSMGSLYLPFPQTCIHTAFVVPVPSAFLAPALFILSFLLVVLQYKYGGNDVVMLLGVYLFIGVTARLCSLATRNTLSARLEYYTERLQRYNPRPSPCERGAGRAVSAGQLFDLYDFFQVHIRDRTMYYLDPNIVRPLCEQYRLSYAERVGPSQVEWFISHFWGTEFRVFCESVRRHAIDVAHTEEEGTWKLSRYWICTFSNNQYKVTEELGVSLLQCSFYKALHSGTCKGTCMILDEQALPLTRSWCLFELLQTIQLEKTDEKFTGLFFCTSTGVLNRGQSTVELSMNIGKRLAGLRLQDADATSQEDKDMINRLVLDQMGSWDAINGELRDHIKSALAVCKMRVDSDFAGLFDKLAGQNTASAGAETVASNPPASDVSGISHVL